MRYGKAIRVLRGARGMSQKQLAELAGLNSSHVSRIESGGRMPSTRTVEVLSKVLKVPPHLLMLMASEKEDLKGVSESEARALASGLLDILLSEE